MSEFLQQYGLIGLLVLVVYGLARVIERLVETKWPRASYGRRRDDQPETSGDRITLRDLRDAIHETRDLSQLNANKLALVERDVSWIKRELGINGRKP